MNSPKQILDWEPAAAPPSLGSEDLHLWKIDCGPGGAPIDAQLTLLSDDERARAERLLLVHHRKRYVRSHAGLRQILAYYANILAHQIVFQHGMAGKPSIAGDRKGIEFNMTTSDDHAFVAVSREQPVGIDCEQLRPRTDLIALARRMFSDADAERVTMTPEDERLAAFYSAWTALEAGVKADGRGLSHRKEPPAMGVLQIAHCIPADGFLAAVARTSLPPSSHWRAFSLPEPKNSNETMNGKFRK